MSLTPMNLQNAFAMIHKSRIPEATKRGRMFESAMTRLVEWWYKTFTVLPTGHIRSRTYEDVQKQLAMKAARATDPKGKGRARDDDDGEDDGELIRSEKSLMKHALMRKGSRDVSAQLFTALCRALGIPARLVVSLQSVPWQANAGKPKNSTKKKSKKVNEHSEQKVGDEESEMEAVDIPSNDTSASSFPGEGRTISDSATPISNNISKGKQKAKPVITLRKSRGRKLGSTPPIMKPTRKLKHSC
jgi:xeroderma pigmentosum group C-complementing protein